MTDRVVVKNIQGVSELDVSFEFSNSGILVITGKNGVGKTTLVKAFRLIDEPDVFQNTSSYQAISDVSRVDFEIAGFEPFTFKYNANQKVMDSRDQLPPEGELLAELPIPKGARFLHFDRLFSRNDQIAAKNAAQDYGDASELINFLHSVYGGNKFENLKSVKIGPDYFYFIPNSDGTYLREDHLSSGEYFLIQIFGLMISGAKLIIIDELDVALDASAQAKLYEALKPILTKYGSRLIVVSHSLAFMNTVEDGGLYYLEKNHNQITLEQRSYSYVKSDLCGFRGFDRYILTEDPVLEGFVKYLISKFSIVPYYQFIIIGVGGIDQVVSLAKKNDDENIFCRSEDLLCLMDGDAEKKFSKSYNGSSLSTYLSIQDIEKYIYDNRDTILNHIKKYKPDPNNSKGPKESDKPKKASKTYWKYLVDELSMQPNQLYKIIFDNNDEDCRTLVNEIKEFLER